MDRGAKDRGGRWCALPITLRIAALMLLYPDFVVSKDSVKVRLGVAHSMLQSPENWSLD